MSDKKFPAWVVMRGEDHIEFVETGPDAEKDAKRVLNRPAGMRARPATIIVHEATPGKRSRA